MQQGCCLTMNTFKFGSFRESFNCPLSTPPTPVVAPSDTQQRNLTSPAMDISNSVQAAIVSWKN